MPRVLSAPGVYAIMARVTRVEGVTEAESAASPRTTTDSSAAPTGRATCRTGLVPEAKVTAWVMLLKPARATDRRYTPMGASGSWKPPSGPETALTENAELAE